MVFSVDFVWSLHCHMFWCVTLPFINLLCLFHESSPSIKKILFAEHNFPYILPGLSSCYFPAKELNSSLHCVCTLNFVVSGIYVELVYIYVLIVLSVTRECFLIWWSSHDWSICTLSAWESCVEYQGELRELPVLKKYSRYYAFICLYIWALFFSVEFYLGQHL